ncbi:D-alanyl-D-alanine carboxypeptidase family protein [Neorhizobium sp. NPDC001467]|uniref:D-alanyl-D-alanine carboxypeptidase family protein n=1 Tax=Neorhizobium sp. NPDC001467 TaxID=3390595 RepID=UPI003D04DB7E
MLTRIAMLALFTVSTLLPGALAAAPGDAAPIFATKARQVYMVEAKSGTVLLANNENQAFPPASLAKLMTMDLVFSALKNGEITPETTYKVSENAWRKGGAPSGTTTMFAALNSVIRVDDLVRGVVIQNGNDACMILAEGMAGSDALFASRLSDRARDLGMSRSVFGNSTGLPDAESHTTARDMVTLARHIHTTYPDYYGLYAQPDFTWNKIFQRNKNPLLGLNMGIDGLGAGFAEGAGFAAVASVERNGTRLFLALGGLASDKERSEEARRILEWGLSAFENRIVFKDGEAVGQASVYGGAQGRVDLVAAGPIELYVPTDNLERLSARIVYRWPLRAPVAVGQDVGVLKVYSGERLLREVPLHAAAAVATGSLVSQATDALLEMMFFWL